MTPINSWEVSRYSACTGCIMFSFDSHKVDDERHLSLTSCRDNIYLCDQLGISDTLTVRCREFVKKTMDLYLCSAIKYIFSENY